MCISANGRNLFHVNAISLSYRIRGMVARRRTNIKARTDVLKVRKQAGSLIELAHQTEVKRHIIRMLMYSAINNIAKGPLPYSILKPLTSSDSPSAKSKGVRFVSARIEINQTINSGDIGKHSHMIEEDIVVKRFSVKRIHKGERKISAMLTSYEIVWATARRAPIRAYLELEDHPATNVE